MLGRVWVVGSLLLTLTAWVAPAPAEEVDGDIARGAKAYSANCGRCHNPRPPTEHNDRDWSIVMVHMRMIAGLPGQQARDVEAFLRASNNPPRPVLKAEPPAPAILSGDQLIDQYGCRGCHAIGGVGGTIAPALEGVFERRDEEWIRVQLQDPRAHNPTTVMPNFGFTDAQVDAIIEVLQR